MLKLFVGNLPPATRENDVRNLFAAFGTVRVEEIRLKRDVA